MVAARRVLVVDDEPIVTKSCRRVLAGQGYDVETTLSGREGLDRAFTERFDLVMTDLKMPDLDGMELVRALRKERPQTVIVIITGYGTVPTAVEAMKLGVADYVEKPFTPEEIAEAVDHALLGAEEEAGVEIDADLVREVLKMASEDNDFGRRLLFEGSRTLSGYSLSSDAKAAILSGDIAWIKEHCGELSSEERDWLRRRLVAVIW